MGRESGGGGDAGQRRTIPSSDGSDVSIKRVGMMGLVWLGGVAAGGLVLHLLGGGSGGGPSGQQRTDRAEDRGSESGIALTEPVRVLPSERRGPESRGPENRGPDRVDSVRHSETREPLIEISQRASRAEGGSRPRAEEDAQRESSRDIRAGAHDADDGLAAADLVPGALDASDGPDSEPSQESGAGPGGSGGPSSRPSADATESGAAPPPGQATRPPERIRVEGAEPTDAEAERIRAEAERLGDRAAELIEQRTADPIRSLSSSMGELREIVGSIGGLRSKLRELKPRDGLDEHAAKLDGLAAEMQGLQRSSIDLHKRLIEVFKQSIAPMRDEPIGDDRIAGRATGGREDRQSGTARASETAGVADRDEGPDDSPAEKEVADPPRER